jgi:tripartite-type tricarboxylate transporter receptor subunit TctC
MVTRKKIFPMTPVVLIWAMAAFFMSIQPCIGAEDPRHFPSKPITIVVPYAAGGASDVVARKLAELATKYLNQSVVVEVKAGGAGVIGTTAVAKSNSDGYTLLLASDSPLNYVPHQRSVPYDPREDFTYIIEVAEFSMPFCVRTDSKFKNFKEFVEEERKNPGKMTYQSQGPKSAGHIQMEFVFSQEKVKIKHIPGAGVAEVVTQLLGGHVNGGIAAGLGAQIKTGTIRPLAVAGGQKNKNYPDAPTFYDLGFKHGAPFGARFGIIGPKGLHPEITKKLHDAFKKAYEDESYVAVMNNLLDTPVYRDSEAYRQISLQDYEQVGKIFRDLSLGK